MAARRVSIATVFVLCCGIAAGQSGAEGFLKVGNVRKELRHARAAIVADRFDKAKQVLHVVFSDAPLPTKAVFDGLELFSLTNATGIQVVEFDFSPEGGVNWYFRVKGLTGTMSMNQSPNPFPFDRKGDIISGKIQAKGDTPGDDPKPYELSLTYTAKVEMPPVEKPVTAEDTAAAAKHPATLAYLDFVDAIRKGDKTRIIANAAPDRRHMIDTPDFEQMLKMIQSIEPTDIRVLKVAAEGDSATLTTTGTMEGKLRHGEAEMTRVEGRWYLRGEKWQD